MPPVEAALALLPSPLQALVNDTLSGVSQGVARGFETVGPRPVLVLLVLLLVALLLATHRVAVSHSKLV